MLSSLGNNILSEMSQTLIDNDNAYKIFSNMSFFKWGEFLESNSSRQSEVIEGLDLRQGYAGTSILIYEKYHDSIEDCFEKILKLEGSEELLFHLDVFKKYALFIPSIKVVRQKAPIYHMGKVTPTIMSIRPRR